MHVDTPPSSGRDRVRGDDGASLVEYTFLIALIALVCFAAIAFLGQSNSASISNSARSIIEAGS